MIIINEIPKMKLYKKQFYLNVDLDKRLKNNYILLLTPNYDSSVRLLNNPLIIKKHYNSYYIEKDIRFIVNNEGYIDYEKTKEILNETNLSNPKLASPILANPRLADSTINKKLKRKLMMQQRKHKYRLNQQSDLDRNAIGLDRTKKSNNDKTKKNNVEVSDKLQDHNKVNVENEQQLIYVKNTLQGNPRISNELINEEVNEYKKQLQEEYNLFVGYTNEDLLYTNDNCIKFNIGDNMNLLFLNELSDNSNFNNKKLNLMFKKERIKTNREVIDIYSMIKEDVPYIKNTFLYLNKYKNKNLFIDTFYYNNLFNMKNTLKRDKGLNLYFSLMDKYINDNRLLELGYKPLNIILVPILDWIEPKENYFDYTKNINILSLIKRCVKTNNGLLSKWAGINFVFITNKGYFVCDLSQLSMKTIAKFEILVDKLIRGDIPDSPEDNIETKKAIMVNIVDKIEDDSKIQLSKVTGDKQKDIDKQEVIDKIEKAASVSTTTNQALDKMNDDEQLKKILYNLQQEEENKTKINQARLSRMMDAQDKSKEKMIEGRSIRDILKESEVEKEIPKVSLDIDSVNDEWQNLTYMNFEEAYDIQEDIMTILYDFANKTEPVVIRDISMEDTSTSEDSIFTYTVKMEDSHGQRFTLKFDIPKFVDNKFMRLRGNEKTINGQLTLIPISKTDEDTIQIVSNYKKIFIYRYGSSAGKSYPTADIINKTLQKYDGKTLTFVEGDSSLICSKYQLPMDYIDLASSYNDIDTKNYKIIFNQDKIRELYNIDDSKGIPYGYDKKAKQVLYWNSNNKQCKKTISEEILYILLQDDDRFNEIALNTKFANRYMFSRANILNQKIPIIIVMAHSEGLEKSLKKANVEYQLTEKRPKKNIDESFIKFKDGYLVYKLDYNSSLLLNGLSECNTEDYSIAEINGKAMWIDFLEIYGGRILSDGLDNFYDLMIDPITKEVLEHYDLPTDYIELLAYSNLLLADNKYTKHTDMNARRYRSNELIAGYTYQALAESYGSYKTEYKKRGSASMSMKQTAVIDKVMLDPTCADLSMLNDIQNAESINALSYKGLSGLNYDRSYDLDKRSYDETMLNLVAMSTGFAGNVGVTRQATIDMNIEGKRGYVKTIDNDTSQMSITKSFSITEAMTPFGTTRDDPMRSAMNFIQTSKHGMRIAKSTPLLISNGADMALPYITSNVFAFNAKDDGKVKELTDDYMVVEYKNGKKDFIDLRNTVRKNSNGGFYQTIKLDTDLKVGNRFKKNEIIAYDRMSYSNEVGPTDDLAYSNWILTKVAMLTTDEGYEDSAIISEWLSDAMASEVVVQKSVTLPKTTNVYSIVKKGQDIQEGEPLIIFQNAFEDEDITALLKNLSDDEDLISDLGRIPVKSKVTGIVRDIKVYRTVDKSELSDSLKKIVNDFEKPIKQIEKTMKDNDIYDASILEPTYISKPTGKLKNVDEGVMIEFYLSYFDKMSVGDKLIYSSAVKGVTKDVIPKGKEPYSEFRPDEKIQTLVPYFGVANRIVCSIFITMAVNKALIELDRKIKDMCDIPWKYLDED